jgi:hypothetical protein
MICIVNSIKIIIHQDMIIFSKGILLLLLLLLAYIFKVFLLKYLFLSLFLTKFNEDGFPNMPISDCLHRCFKQLFFFPVYIIFTGLHFQGINKRQRH